ncbi:serine hydroxymethyltransferase [Striga asiatica]|uniref:Serine hydroxymethyltransferase n=1 Tax=Striga asiatica TaxID=4170 RepID=A0A5A7PGQ8_STRAF|nr:serine hydroxymethyltransferase [Striga asiatica]
MINVDTDKPKYQKAQNKKIKYQKSYHRSQHITSMPFHGQLPRVWRLDRFSGVQKENKTEEMALEIRWCIQPTKKWNFRDSGRVQIRVGLAGIFFGKFAQREKFFQHATITKTSPPSLARRPASGVPDPCSTVYCRATLRPAKITLLV